MDGNEFQEAGRFEKPEEATIATTTLKGESNPFIPKFEEFFSTHEYKKKIETLAHAYPQVRSLVVDFNDLDSFDYQLAEELLEHPDLLFEAARLAVKKIEVSVLQLDKFEPNVRFRGLPKDQQPLVRDISAKQLGKLISVEGVIRQVTEVMPKLKNASWRCKRCGNAYQIEQDGHQQRKPALCSCKHRDFELVPEESAFVDYQKVQIQEPLESLKGSEQAVNLDVYIEDDFVNRVYPGNRTQMTGVLRLYPPNKDKKNVYGRYLEVIHVEETEKEFEDVTIVEEDEIKIRELSQNPKIYDILIQSIAPAIHGHEMIKESISLQLFGGVRKNLPGDNKIRGNIHVLLVGDPGTGKSVLLQATDKIAPKSVYVSGKGSSSAGLCVAPDSLIMNHNGFKSIQEFVETKFDEKLAMEELPGAFSNDFSGQTFTLTDQLDFETKSVEKIWRIKAPPKMFKMTTRTGRELSLTPATSLIRIKNSKAEWIEANALQSGDYIAVPRFLPEGKRKNIPTFTVLLDDPYIKVGNPLAEWMKEIIEKLVPKYGSKQAIAKKVGKSRDTIYAIQNPKFHHGWELQKVVELAREAGYSDDQIAQKITTLFIRHGITNRIPPYLDDPDVAYLVGAIMGDGSMEESDERTTIRLCGNDPQILERCTNILYEKFGIIPEKEKSDERVPSLRMSSRILGKILYAHGMRHTKKENSLSHTATEMPNHILRNLLQGLFDTDGCADDSKTGGKNVSISSISPPLAQTIHLSLLKFGIISKKRFRKRAGNVAIGKKITVISRNDQYCIEIYGKKNLEQFREKIGFGLTRKQETLDKIIQSIHYEKTNIDFVPEIKEALQKTNAENQYKKGKARISYAKLNELMKNEEESFLQKLSNANVLWDQIKKKEEFVPPYQYVYDMTVSGSHNFIANGFYVHNTASAVKDDFGEGGWTLKAGALVLASGGMVMVDEFDKMEEEDRSAMHEAMEQGQVSIAKAGIVTRFKTDTSVLAAANPKLSRFDTYKPFFEQIDLPASLISRFDLFFMVRDTLDKKRDETIASHILATHKAGEQLLQYERGNKQIDLQAIEEITKKIAPIIDIELLRKYISFARQRVFPILSVDAAQAIQDFYVGLRDQGRQAGSYSATARQLEGLVRLAEASARVRLSDEVTLEDADRAIRLVRSSLEDVVKDPETGRIDIDIVTSGQTQSGRDHMRVITEIIKAKSKEMDKVPIQDVVAEAISRGIDEEKVRDIIVKLKKSGEIYEPSHGFLKAA
ncbi:MAG: LAGLIDADG family homing endonuclease [archaeon]